MIWFRTIGKLVCRQCKE